MKPRQVFGHPLVGLAAWLYMLWLVPLMNISPTLLFILLAVGAIGAAVVAFYNFGIAVEWIIQTSGKVRDWTAKRRAGPTDEELGDWEHGERIDKLWDKLTKQRHQMYEALVGVHQSAREQAALLPQGANAERLNMAAKALAPHVRKLASVAGPFATTAEALRVSYRRVIDSPELSGTGSAQWLEQYRDSMKELRQTTLRDIELLSIDRDAVAALGRKTLAMRRVADEYARTIERLNDGSKAIVTACDQVEEFTVKRLRSR